jgi:hypothetical protein
MLFSSTMDVPILKLPTLDPIYDYHLARAFATNKVLELWISHIEVGRDISIIMAKLYELFVTEHRSYGQCTSSSPISAMKFLED